MRALRAPRQGGLASDIVPGTVDGVEIRGLRVVFPTDAGELPAVSDVDLDLPAGTITGLVGESGSGKSTLALAMLNAVPKPGRIAAGSIRLPTVEDVTTLQGAALRRARGTALGYVFQASQSSLNPLKRVGAQLLDVGRAHGVDDRHVLLGRAKDLCERMGLDATRVLAAYQHELSGGMRQRVGIVFALVLNAKVLVLDEPTTALDMLSQAAVLEIVREVHKERNLSTLIITHDIAIVADLADRVAVMYGGRLVEQGPTREVLRHPSHPYARGLLAAMPRISGDIDDARPLTGRPPDLASVPQVGCVFRERCPLRVERCERDEPALVAVGSESSWPSDTIPVPHGVACHVTAPVSDHDGSPDGSESS
jgi:peptide/nickel transport system ATP-binding protein